jgi:hypothetical protein
MRVHGVWEARHKDLQEEIGFKNFPCSLFFYAFKKKNQKKKSMDKSSL